jgi:hypothetical protein
LTGRRRKLRQRLRGKLKGFRKVVRSQEMRVVIVLYSSSSYNSIMYISY